MTNPRPLRDSHPDPKPETDLIERLKDRLVNNGEMIKAFPASPEVSDLVYRNDTVIQKAISALQDKDARIAELEVYRMNDALETNRLREAVEYWESKSVKADQQRDRIAELEAESTALSGYIEGHFSEQLCCSGQDCGCMGSTQGQEIVHYVKRDARKALAGLDGGT